MLRRNKSTTMTAVRRRVWKGKTGRANIVSAPKLQSLPPTDESFLLNAKRSHFQACIWRHADESSPPSLDPLEHGWMRDTVTKVLTHVMLPTRVPPAPDYILRMIKCSCGNCGSARCSCVSSALPCTVFCRLLLLLSFAFHDLRFCLSSQLKAASCARCSSEMPPSKQVNGHSFTTCLIVWGSPHSQSGEAI